MISAGEQSLLLAISGLIALGTLVVLVWQLWRGRDKRGPGDGGPGDSGGADDGGPGAGGPGDSQR